MLLFVNRIEESVGYPVLFPAHAVFSLIGIAEFYATLEMTDIRCNS